MGVDGRSTFFKEGDESGERRWLPDFCLRPVM